MQTLLKINLLNRGLRFKPLFIFFFYLKPQPNIYFIRILILSPETINKENTIFKIQDHKNKQDRVLNTKYHKQRKYYF